VNDSPLHQFSTSDWASTLDAILPDIHDVDRSAARIWSYFYPLALDDAYAADEPQTVTRRLRIDGNARLSQGQVDSSHWFLYGHRYWPAVKAALVGWAGREPGGWTADLLATARALNSEVAARAGVDARLVAGISFVGLMTLRQPGFDRVRASLRSQPFVSGSQPAYADYIVFSPLQWARIVAPVDILESGDALAAWRERMLDLYAGLGRTTPARA